MQPDLLQRDEYTHVAEVGVSTPARLLQPFSSQTDLGLGLSTVICTESSDRMSTNAPELRYLRAFLTGSGSHDEAQGMIQGFQVDSDGAHSR